MTELEADENRLSSERTASKVRLLTAEDLLSLGREPGGNRQSLPLQQLVVEGLLSFGEMTRFEFGRLNILVGANGSGKSNLIDCLRVFRYAPLDVQETFRDSGFEEWLYQGSNKQSGTAFLQVTAEVPGLLGRLRHEIRLGPPRTARTLLEEVISSAEIGDEQDNPYFEGSYRSHATLFESTNKRRHGRTLKTDEYDPFLSILSQIRDVGRYPEISRLSNLYANFRIYSEWTFGRNSSLREATPTGRSDSMLSESMSDLALALNGLEETTAHEKIRNLLQELKETYRDYVTRILFGRVGLELAEAPFDTPLPAKRLSDGTLRFLALAAILLQPSPPPLICLEEPELGMHPDMIRMVARMIADASSKTQLIVTTHSEHLLTALQEDFDVLFAFDAGPRGSVVQSLSKIEYLEWRADHDLGELWSSGEIGGVRY